MAKTNLIRQKKKKKKWPPGVLASFPYIPTNFKYLLKPVIRNKIDLLTYFGRNGY